jgi:hypothetical protein
MRVREGARRRVFRVLSVLRILGLLSVLRVLGGVLLRVL